MLKIQYKDTRYNAWMQQPQAHYGAHFVQPHQMFQPHLQGGMISFINPCNPYNINNLPYALNGSSFANVEYNTHCNRKVYINHPKAVLDSALSFLKSGIHVEANLIALVELLKSEYDGTALDKERILSVLERQLMFLDPRISHTSRAVVFQMLDENGCISKYKGNEENKEATQPNEHIVKYIELFVGVNINYFNSTLYLLSTAMFNSLPFNQMSNYPNHYPHQHQGNQCQMIDFNQPDNIRIITAI